jgi:hypothetical protein
MAVPAAGALDELSALAAELALEWLPEARDAEDEACSLELALLGAVGSGAGSSPVIETGVAAPRLVAGAMAAT